MTSNRFNEIVKNRANERVQEKVKIFESKIAAAFRELHPCLNPNNGNKWFGGTSTPYVKSILRNIMGVPKDKDKSVSVGYPLRLWEDEESAVEKEMLATMDEMAKALLAPPADSNDLMAVVSDTPDTHDTVI
jgi:hypothetical protein